MDKALALFDFDGTITRKDTLLDFMMFVRGRAGAAGVFLRLLPSAAAFMAGRLTNQVFKERYLTLAFGGMEEPKLRESGQRYLDRLEKLIRAGALDRLEWHRKQQHRIIIVSASADVWLEPWCRKHRVEMICSSLEFHQGICSGRLSGSNCRGPEKVRRIRNVVDTDAYSKIFAYGDSSGDTEMLAFAHEGRYRPFH